MYIVDTCLEKKLIIVHDLVFLSKEESKSGLDIIMLTDFEKRRSMLFLLRICWKTLQNWLMLG